MLQLVEDKDKREFRKRMEANVQNFMPFFPDMGALLEYPLRFLREKPGWSEDDEYLVQEQEMAEAVAPSKKMTLTNILEARKHGKHATEAFTDSRPKNLARLIIEYSNSMGDKAPSIMITGNAGSGKTIFSGKVFAELCELIDPVEGKILLTFSQLKDTGGEGEDLWSKIIAGIRYPNLGSVKDAFDLNQILTKDNDYTHTILIIDSLDETARLDKEAVDKQCITMKQNRIYPVWICREGDFIANRLDELVLDTNSSSSMEKDGIHRVEVPPLTGEVVTEIDQKTEWIQHSFRSIPLLYSFQTNFLFTKEERKETHDRFIETLKELHNKIDEEFSEKKFKQEKELSSKDWGRLLEKKMVPVLSDILCKDMLSSNLDAYLDRLKGTELGIGDETDFQDDVKNFLNKSAEYMFGVISENGHLDEIIPNSLREDTDEMVLFILSQIGLTKGRSGGILRYSHRAFAEFILWNYISEEDRNSLIEQPIFSWRRFLLQPEKLAKDSFWESPDPHSSANDSNTIVVFFRNTASFLMSLPPLLDCEREDEGVLAQPWKASFNPDYGFIGRSTRAASTEDPSPSKQQVKAIKKYVQKHSPIQIRGFPGTGKTFTGVEVLITKLATSDQPTKRALIVTLNPALTKDIREDIRNKHANSAQLGNLSARDLLGTGSNGRLIQPLSIEEIFELWAPDLKYKDLIIDEADLKKLFGGIVRGEANHSMFRSAYTDFNYEMFDNDGNLKKLKEYRKSSVLSKAANHQGINDKDTEEMVNDWYSAVNNRIEKGLSIHKACMILINRLRVLEGTMVDQSNIERANQILFGGWESGHAQMLYDRGEIGPEELERRRENEAGEKINEIMAVLSKRVSSDTLDSPTFYDMVLVDEIQDLPFQAVVLMSYLTMDREHAHDLIYVGDHAQSLRYDMFNWDKFFSQSKYLADKLKSEIPEKHPKKFSHHLSHLDRLATDENEIFNLDENWRNSSSVLKMFKDATKWKFKDGELTEKATTSVENVDKLVEMRERAEGFKFGYAGWIRTETLQDYEDLIIEVFRYAAENSELSIIVCDRSLEIALLEAMEEGNSLENYRTEFFDTFTIKGLERPRTVVLGGWMVSKHGDHSIVARNNRAYSKNSKPKIEEDETDRINRRMLVALSRAQDRMAVIVPPIGAKSEQRTEASMFSKEKHMFVQLQPPNLDEYTSTFRRFKNPSDEEKFGIALIGLSEGIEYKKRVGDDEQLDDQLKNNKARVTRLVELEIADGDTGFLLSKLFKNIDGVQLKSSSLYRFLEARLYGLDDDEWREAVRNAEFNESESYKLLNDIKDENFDSISGFEGIDFVESLQYAKIQHKICNKIRDLDPGAAPIDADLREQRFESAERNIRREIQEHMKLITPDDPSKFSNMARGFVTMISNRDLDLSKIEKLPDDKVVEKLNEFMEHITKGVQEPLWQGALNQQSVTRILENNLVKVTWLILKGLEKEQIENLSCLPEYIDIVGDIGSIPSIEVALVSYLPKFRDPDGSDIKKLAELFLVYLGQQERNKGHENSEQAIAWLNELVNTHPLKLELLQGIMGARKGARTREFERNIARLDPDLRYSIIENSSKDPKLKHDAYNLMNSLIDDLVDQFLPNPLLDIEKNPTTLKKYEWWDLDDDENIKPHEEYRWRLDYEKMVLYQKKGRRSLNRIDNLAREIAKSVPGGKSKSLLTKLEVAISLIQSHEELVKAEADWNPIPGAKKTTKTVALGAMEIIAEKLESSVNHVIKPNNELKSRHLTNIYYLWAAAMHLGRKPSLQRKFPRELEAFAVRYPHFPKIITDSNGDIKAEHSKPDDIIGLLEFDILQDFLVMNIENIIRSEWSNTQTLIGKDRTDRELIRRSPHKKLDFQPKFFHESMRNYWNKPDSTFGPLKITYQESYIIFRSMQIPGPSHNNEILLGTDEEELFTNYQKVCTALINGILQAEGRFPIAKTITGEGLFTSLIRPLNIEKFAQDRGLEQSGTRAIKKFLEKGDYHIAMWPQIDSSVIKNQYVRRQQWGNIQQEGLIKNLLNKMGIEIETTPNGNGRIDLANVDPGKLRSFRARVHREIGYTVRRKGDNEDGLLLVRRGSKTNKGETVLFHGTKSSCLEKISELEEEE